MTISWVSTSTSISESTTQPPTPEVIEIEIDVAPAQRKKYPPSVVIISIVLLILFVIIVSYAYPGINIHATKTTSSVSHNKWVTGSHKVISTRIKISHQKTGEHKTRKYKHSKSSGSHHKQGKKSG
ncbi:uncharacterized protein LOC133845218 [Drosophila sulfurigaster albostrigata]|uniref:uncharacterized protein LOC133845218 n=1 Tax=Drosophila sulfurigaster albostrigata TaxID=89887 RepID=UPI002D219D1F|nr:uncharacterized protein LOC133845218 [Drosophila sulfurigaster albostrigata]